MKITENNIIESLKSGEEQAFRYIYDKYYGYLCAIAKEMWSEWIPRIEDMQRQVFPRIAAYAESGWTIENKKNFTRFSTSLSQILIPRWKQKNIAWHKESTPQAE